MRIFKVTFLYMSLIKIFYLFFFIFHFLFFFILLIFFSKCVPFDRLFSLRSLNQNLAQKRRQHRTKCIFSTCIKNIIIDSPFVVLTVPYRPRIHLGLSGASIIDGSIALKQHALALSYIHFYARRKRIFDRISIIDVYLQHLHTRVTAIILLFAAIYCLASHRITRDTCNIRSRVLFSTSPNICDCRLTRRCVSTHIFVRSTQ